MSDLQTADKAGSGLFGGSESSDRGGLPASVWAVAALIVVVVVGGLVFAGRKKAAPPPNTLLPEDAYAANLSLSQLAMSESDSVSGVKVTYLDGHIQNTGQKTVAGVTVQVVFGNDEALPPQIDTMALTLIRTRQPYVDTEPVSAEPLKPGDEKEFRLIFESVPQNWNTQMPQVRIVHSDTR
jgi:hypothetical protein